MKVILFIAVFMVTMLARGQGYLPLLEEHRVWSIMHEKHTIIGDTIINETTYKKLYYHNFSEELIPDSLKYIAALREDTLLGKVWFIWTNNDTEILLYDFSLEVGDIFEVKSPFFTFFGPFHRKNPVGNRFLKVTEISDAIIGNETRKIIELIGHEGSFGLTEHWIEGIGSTVGLIYAGYSVAPITNGAYPSLLCVHENQVLIYNKSEFWGKMNDSCYKVPATNTGEIAQITLDITATPTLFKEQITLVSQSPLIEITIINLKGIIVYQIQTSEPFTPVTIETSNWEKGLYVVRASNSHSVITKKIIKY